MDERSLLGYWADSLMGYAGDGLALLGDVRARNMAAWDRLSKASSIDELKDLGPELPIALGGTPIGVPGKLAGSLWRSEGVASRSAGLYNPPSKPARPFSKDYPDGAEIDAAGKLLRDIEGRPLGARWVAGRRDTGGGDHSFPASELDALAEAATGKGPQDVASHLLRGEAGLYALERERYGGRVLDQTISLNRGLSPQQRQRVLAHETGHAIDAISGGIPTEGLQAELRHVYNTLNTGQERTRNLTGPQHQGYGPADIDKELMAEALRAYLADPNYLKTVAPKTAARIRAHVNAHPELAKTIQFNAIAPPFIGADGRKADPMAAPSGPPN